MPVYLAGYPVIRQVMPDIRQCHDYLAGYPVIRQVMPDIRHPVRKTRSSPTLLLTIITTHKFSPQLSSYLRHCRDSSLHHTRPGDAPVGHQKLQDLFAKTWKAKDLKCVTTYLKWKPPIISVRSDFSSVFRFSFSFKLQICIGRTEIICTLTKIWASRFSI